MAMAASSAASCTAASRAPASSGSMTTVPLPASRPGGGRGVETGGAESLSGEGVEGLLQGIGRDHGGQQVDERVGVQLRGEANELLPGDGPRVSHVEAGGHGAHGGGVGVRRGPGAQGGEVGGGVAPALADDARIACPSAPR